MAHIQSENKNFMLDAFLGSLDGLRIAVAVPQYAPADANAPAIPDYSPESKALAKKLIAANTNDYCGTSDLNDYFRYTMRPPHIISRR